MGKVAANQYSVTGEFAQKVKGYIKAPKVGANGNEINFGWSNGAITQGTSSEITFSNLSAGEYSISFNTLTYAAAPFVKLLLNGSEMEMVDDDHYSIDLNLKQGDNITADIPNFDQYWIDPDFFEKNEDGSLKFLPIDGTYRVIANLALNYLEVLKMNGTSTATLNDDGTGALWIIGDGIATVYGIEHAMYGEIVVFDNGVKGMVQDIKRTEIGCILFGKDTGIREGTRVVRTGKKAGIPVGDAFVGRIIDALGAPIDGQGEIESTEYRPIEQDAPGIVDRKSVSEPMETGILAIDSMFPIGRGQRELIIGDRQTGKTAIAIDTILNQKGKDVICIYVAIGQKASTVAKIVNTLKKYDAMDYSIVLSATASDPAPLQYIAPYSGTALAEYFMHKGKDVLIVYDDLSKHAVAYRALSLLLERSPGREAYPGDVFYLHSRLLERSSRLSDALGGGSITALPIIETQAGDVSAYIPTNVISITDGQIFLESNLFFSGMRPAVNVGLSVSRVGGAAQTKAMKKASGSIRIDLAQFREMEVFTQFSSDLDAATKEQLQYGNSLMEMLKQPLYRPLSQSEQVVSLCCATHKVMMDIEKSKIKQFQMDLLEHFNTRQTAIMETIERDKVLTDELTQQILDAANAFKASYKAS